MTIPYQTLDISGDPTPWVLAQPNDNKEWVVLWLQGWGSTIESHFEAVKKLAEKSGIAIAMIDYAGFGQHTVLLSETTREQQHHEVVAAYDKLKALGYENIIACGHSFGSYMSALLASQREVASLILRAPAIYEDSEFSIPQKQRSDVAYQAFKQTVRPNSPLAALQAIKKYDGPVFVFEYGADEVIPRNIPQSYFANALQGSYIYVPHSPHSPKTSPNSRIHYRYIEVAILEALQLTKLSKL